jgi:ketosteroid isomerase-like protein
MPGETVEKNIVRSNPHTEAARRLIECVTSGDVAGVGALYHDDIRCWRNLDGRELVKKQALKVVGFLGTLEGLAYEDIRIDATETGFVQQHTLCCTSPKGEAVRVAACLVAEVRDGQILRIDEYVDSAAMAPLMA